MKTALVLSGGSIKGAFQAGAISALLNNGVEPEGIYGVSAGALNGAFLADRAGRQLASSSKINWRQVGSDLEQFWMTRITKPADIVEKRWLGGIASGALFNRFKGLTKVDKFHALIRAEIDKTNLRRFAGSGRHFQPGAVDVFTSKIIYETAVSDNIIDYTLASAAIPVAFPVMNIDVPPTGIHPFVDGGVRDLAPLRRAIKDGFDNIICIVCQSQNLDAFTYNTGNLLGHIDRITDIIVNEIVLNDIGVVDAYRRVSKVIDFERNPSLKEIMRYRDIPKPTVIWPKSPILVDIMKFNRKQIAAMIQQGKDAVNHAKSHG
ncbi:patatin-like phospholipase family protein [Mesorhizobium sp. M0751]|uniref:patatin-like phospholipase family protein n=1 Tax=unclassified Mesorhizobium TaxID=325217 RepID=UPI0033389EAE